MTGLSEQPAGLRFSNKTTQNASQSLAEISNLKEGETMKPESEYLLIIDGSSLLATSYFSSLPKAIRKEKDEEKKEELYSKLLKRDADGRYCDAIEAFFHTIFTILTYQRPTHLAVCWDVNRHTFRKSMWPSYKSNRSSTPTPLAEQYQTAYTLCQELGIAQFQHPDYEADDFAGSLAVQMEKQLPVRLLTRDKDYFQLISPRTKIWYGMSDRDKVHAWRTKYNMPAGLPSRVVEVDDQVLEGEFGYSASCVCMMKALMGDRSDNIPGVRGIGETRAVALARHYSSVEDLYRAIDRAQDPRARKTLFATWRSWGIRKNPYSCLTRKGGENAHSAREMAELCYVLGKMKTDLVLPMPGGYPGMRLKKEHLQFSLNARDAQSILEQYNIELNIRLRPSALKRMEAASASARSAKGSSDSSRKNGRSGSSSSRPNPVKTAEGKRSNSKKPNVHDPRTKKTSAWNGKPAGKKNERKAAETARMESRKNDGRRKPSYKNSSASSPKGNWTKKNGSGRVQNTKNANAYSPKQTKSSSKSGAAMNETKAMKTSKNARSYPNGPRRSYSEVRVQEPGRSAGSKRRKKDAYPSANASSKMTGALPVMQERPQLSDQ